MSEFERHRVRHSDDGEDAGDDVEAHQHFKKRGDEGPSTTEMEQHFKKHSDDGDDDGPDVEAHVFNYR